MAQLRRDWRSAVKLWRARAEKRPDDPNAAIGLIGALISAGGLEEAAERADAFVRNHPKDENGPTMLARIAELRGDDSAAIEHWGAALTLKPDRQQALIRLGAALLKESRFAEALACAERLEARFPSSSHGAILRAQTVQQERGFHDAAGLWEKARGNFGNDAAFLRAYGRARLAAGTYDKCLAVAADLRNSDLHASLSLEGAVLSKRAPCEDHTAFWKSACAQLPDSVDLIRKLLHAALAARDIATADTAFGRLLQQDRLSVRDASMVVGLVNIDLQSEDRAAARTKIRKYLKGMRGMPGYRAAALRLHRSILQCFPSCADFARRISANTPLFLNLVGAARLGPGAAQPLQQIAAMERLVRETGEMSLLDSDIDSLACRAFIGVVRERLRGQAPFSFIRLGDGEANALQQSSSFAPQFDADAAEREKVWWGRMLDPAVRSELAARVRKATFESDAIGFPTREWFLRDVRLDTGAALSGSKSGRGLLVVAETIERENGAGRLAGKLLTSAHLPQDLQRWDLYSELFDGVTQVVLVSCHPALPQLLRQRFRLETVKHVLIAPGDSMREMEHRTLSEEEIPPRSLDRALDELGDWPNGRLVLAGAGYAGKVITGEAKRRGGIALDLGSIFDHWLGLHTRSYQDLA